MTGFGIRSLPLARTLQQVSAPCLLQAARRSPLVCRGSRALPSSWSPLALSNARFASSAASKVIKVLEGELKHEKENYEQAKEVKAFLAKSPFKFVDTPGDVNLALEREVGDKTVRIEWQLSSPFDPEEEGEENQEAPGEETELSVTVEDKKTGAGLVFYCSTQAGEDHRYIIGNVRTYASKEEKDSVSGYNGPEFEDLDDKLQEAFDEYLAELGINSEVCDFIDAMATDKEQREYVRWLTTAKSFLES